MDTEDSVFTYGRFSWQKILRSSDQQNLLLWVLASLILGVSTWLSLEDDHALLTGVAGAGFVIALIGLVSQLWYFYSLNKALQADGNHRLLNDLRRANMVYRFSATLNSTLDYNKILQQALEAGPLGVSTGVSTKNMVSAVLLFRPSDNLLHVAAARLLNVQDYRTPAPGREGILAQALENSKPILGRDGALDPELRRYTGFQNSKSLLAISLRQAYETYGVMVFGVDVPDAFDKNAMGAMTAIGVQVAFALKNAVLYQGILMDKARIVSIDEQARKKLSRDLHDGPTQTIALISSISQVVKTYLKRGEVSQAMEELDKVHALAQKTTKEIRHLLFSLRPLVLENKGLVAALVELAKKAQETYGQNVNVDAEATVEEYLDTDEQGTIFYIIEEAINNAIKHAEAKMIWLRLSLRPPFILIEVEDNGKGFNIASVTTDYDKRGSLGMVNLRERSEMLRAEFNIQSELGRGTKITVLMPMPEAKKNKVKPILPSVDPMDTVMANNILLDITPKSTQTRDEAGWADLNVE